MSGFGYVRGGPLPPRQPGGKPGTWAKHKAAQQALSGPGAGFGVSSAPRPFSSPGASSGLYVPPPFPPPRPFYQQSQGFGAGAGTGFKGSIPFSGNGAGPGAGFGVSSGPRPFSSPGASSGLYVPPPFPPPPPFYQQSQGFGAGAGTGFKGSSSFSGNGAAMDVNNNGAGPTPFASTQATPGSGAGAGKQSAAIEPSEIFKTLAEQYPAQEISLPYFQVHPEPYRNANVMKGILNTNAYNLFFIFTHGELIRDTDPLQRYGFKVPEDTIVIQTGAGPSFGCVTLTSLDTYFVPLFKADRINESLSFLLGLEGASTGGHDIFNNFIFATPGDRTLNKRLTLDGGDIYDRKNNHYWGIYVPSGNVLQPDYHLTKFVLDKTNTVGGTTEEEVATHIQSRYPRQLSILIFVNCVVGREGSAYSESYNLAQTATKYSLPLGSQPQTAVPPAETAVKSKMLFPPPPKTTAEKVWASGFTGASAHFQNAQNPKYYSPEEIEEQAAKPKKKPGAASTSPPPPTKKYLEIMNEETANYIRQEFAEGLLPPDQIAAFTAVGVFEGGRRRAKTKRVKRRASTRRPKKTRSK